MAGRKRHLQGCSSVWVSWVGGVRGREENVPGRKDYGALPAGTPGITVLAGGREEFSAAAAAAGETQRSSRRVADWPQPPWPWSCSEGPNLQSHPYFLLIFLFLLLPPHAPSRPHHGCFLKHPVTSPLRVSFPSPPSQATHPTSGCRQIPSRCRQSPPTGWAASPFQLSCSPRLGFVCLCVWSCVARQPGNGAAVCHFVPISSQHSAFLVAALKRSLLS